MELAKNVYALTKELPNSEVFGLTSQVQRSAISIPSNIAEGSQRNNRNEFKHFCGIAYGSSAELETQLMLIEQIYKINTRAEITLLTEIQKMLNKLIKSLETKH